MGPEWNNKVVNITAVKVAQVLGDHQAHTAADIARKVGTHSRTVRRWVGYLREEFGMIIDSTPDGFLLREKGKPDGGTK